MRKNISRINSFIIIGVVYLLATIVGFYVFNLVEGDIWLKVLIGDVVATVVTYLASVIFSNSSVYDPYWSVQPIVITIGLATSKTLNVSMILCLIAISLWGIRLTLNWAYTFKGLFYQDWRYTGYESKTGKFYQLINFTGIHLFPTIVVYLCTMPAVRVITENSVFSPFCILGFLVCIGATILQGVADYQMHLFRKAKTGGFIRNGLWKYSRHPNYLGEILMWWGIGIIAFFALPDITNRILLFVGAVVNNLMFIFVSVPLADGKQSKKQGFEEYKEQTRKFLPIKK